MRETAIGEPGSAGSAQTLDRGLRILEVLAGAPEGLPVTTVATRLGLHRTVVYRLLGTLAQHRLVARGADGRYRLGLGLVELSRAVAPHLQSIAIPELARLAEELGATAALTVADGDEAVALAVVEPRRTDIHVAYRAGLRHPLFRGASGMAILAGRPPEPGERREVALARERGYAVSHGELQRGAMGVAAPIRAGEDPAQASVGVITLAEFEDEAKTAARVVEAAQAIARALV